MQVACFSDHDSDDSFDFSHASIDRNDGGDGILGIGGAIFLLGVPAKTFVSGLLVTTMFLGSVVEDPLFLLVMSNRARGKLGDPLVALG